MGKCHFLCDHDSDDLNAQYGDGNIHSGDLDGVKTNDWLQDFANYLGGKNLTYLQEGLDNKLVVDMLMVDEGWNLTTQRLNPESLGVLRAATCVCDQQEGPGRLLGMRVQQPKLTTT
ncbi:unnamed protein product [Lota lota]